MTTVKHITVLFNRVTKLSFGINGDILADEDTVKTAQNIAKVLKTQGYEVLLFEVNEGTVGHLGEIKTDFFFNLCGGIGNIVGSEYKVPKILDSIKIPYSGASADSLSLTTDKVKTKKMFKLFGIPTPDCQVFQKTDEKLSDSLRFPLIVKPTSKDCSLGVDNDSVVEDKKSLYDKVEKIIRDYQTPALVEAYINTRELNVTIIGNGDEAMVLPISEIIFGKSYVNKKHKIVDFAAKWLTGSESYKDTVGVCPAKLFLETRKKIEALVLRAYHKICGNPGYARIDIRLSEEEKIFFLEINLNPDISDGMGASRSAKAFGWSYPEFLRKIIEVSIERFHQ